MSTVECKEAEYLIANVKRLLARDGISQNALGRHLGIDSSAMSLKLSGKRPIKLSEASKIAELLGTSLPDMIRKPLHTIDKVTALG